MTDETRTPPLLPALAAANAVLMVGFAWLVFMTPRLIGLPVLLVSSVVVFRAVRARRPRRALLATGAFVAISVLPFDVRVTARDVPVRLVPYVTGYPDRVLLERAERGEVVLGGCVVNGLQPSWVLLL